jgi:hypothetical protein
MGLSGGRPERVRKRGDGWRIADAPRGGGTGLVSVGRRAPLNKKRDM